MLTHTQIGAVSSAETSAHETPTFQNLDLVCAMTNAATVRLSLLLQSDTSAGGPLKATLTRN